ncbi:MAG TPA: permease prefix domain 1-containing protein [Casimicrobiaceae bacterium]|jgi:hypothetical protein|nr:permease prefix domain 1-containing protein [Casimicrobiaceae bacterium]
MAGTDAMSLDAQVGAWRNYVRRRRAIEPVDIAELEDHLREQVATLMDRGLAVDEAFLIAVKRLGSLDALSREFAREHADRLWKQLVVARSEPAEVAATSHTEAAVAFALAAGAALAVKLPALFGLHIVGDAGFYGRNAALFALPFVTGYFAWKRGLDLLTTRRLIAAFMIAALFANVYPAAWGRHDEVLTALHLPIALWLVVGIAYAGGRWSDGARRMDFIRFSGELFIYYVLIALGGGVLTAFMAMMFRAIGIDVAPLFQAWLLPCGAAAALVVASWLVEAKQSVIENMAPVLTGLFTPLFAIVLTAFLGTMLWTGRGIDIARDVLIGFDLLLVVVLGLLLYAVSARDPRAPRNGFDILRIVLVVVALLADVLALCAIAARINEFGLTPNRVAALGENVILLVNLGGSAVFYVRFVTGHDALARLERWQTAYLPVYAGWAALVVIVFPPLFRYV